MHSSVLRHYTARRPTSVPSRTLVASVKIFSSTVQDHLRPNTMPEAEKNWASNRRRLDNSPEGVGLVDVTIHSGIADSSLGCCLYYFLWLRKLISSHTDSAAESLCAPHPRGQNFDLQLHSRNLRE
jgi:hypothetical protein